MTATPAKISDLDTPALLIDLDIMERNLRRMADYTAKHGLRLRPHTKTHKIPALARQQIDLGAVGLTIAKVGEAEVMLEADPPDLLLAYPIVGRRKLNRLMDVAKRAPVTVSLDSLTVARELSDAASAAQVEIGVLAEIDVGLGRVGVQPSDAVSGAQHRGASVAAIRRHRVLSGTHPEFGRPGPQGASGFKHAAQRRRPRFETGRIGAPNRQRRLHSHHVS